MASPYKVNYQGMDFVLGIISGNRIAYNLELTIRFLESKGKYIYGKKFKILKKDFTLIHKLLVYMIKDEKNSKEFHIDLNKGILLSGPIGCGKTALMNLVKSIVIKRNLYEVKSTRLVSFEYIRDGHQVISSYSNTKNYCFDDLGLEQNLKRYGNECNVMGEILLSRYDLFISHNVITHATTNLNSNELEKYYGNRVRSRMKEMFNLISFDKNAEDKRI